MGVDRGHSGQGSGFRGCALVISLPLPQCDSFPAGEGSETLIAVCSGLGAAIYRLVVERRAVVLDQGPYPLAPSQERQLKGSPGLSVPLLIS